MLRLERDELLYSPIVRSRRDTSIDIDDFTLDSLPELPSIPDLPSISFLEFEHQTMVDPSENPPPSASAKHSENDNVIHQHHRVSSSNLNDTTFDESNIENATTSGVLSDYKEGDIDLMQEAMSFLSDATEDKSLFEANRCRTRFPKTYADFSQFSSEPFPRNQQTFDEESHRMAAMQEDIGKSNIEIETSSELRSLAVPQVTFDEDDVFDCKTFFNNKNPVYQRSESDSAVSIASHLSYNQPSQWLRQQISSDAASFHRSWSEMAMDRPKPRNTIKVDVRASPATKHKHWSKEEDETLRFATESEPTGPLDWIQIAQDYFNNTRSATQCKNRWKNYLKPGIVRGNWKKAEDQFIISMVGRGFKWVDIAKGLPGRTGEHVRERYVNVLDKNLKRTSWTKEEDRILFEQQRILGNKWSEIRKLLPGRSDNSIKNRYHNRKNAYLRRMKREAQQRNAAP